MDYTPNFNLRKPSNNDPVNIGDLNTNMDIIDANLGGSGETETGIWNPYLYSAGGAIFTNNGTGRYVKNGNLVYAQFDLTSTATGGITYNTLELRGMPYPPINNWDVGSIGYSNLLDGIGGSTKLGVTAFFSMTGNFRFLLNGKTMTVDAISGGNTFLLNGSIMFEVDTD